MIEFMQMSHPVPPRPRRSNPDPAQLSFLGLFEPPDDRVAELAPDDVPDVERAQGAVPGEPSPVMPEPAAAADAGTSGAYVLPRPAVPPANLEQVIVALGQVPGPSRRYRGMKSATRTVARVLDRRPVDIPTEPKVLRELLAKAVPAAAKVKSAHWTACRSRLLTALSELGVEVMPGRYTGGPSEEWAELLLALPDKGSRAALSRLISFFSREAISPEQVDASHLRRFESELITASLHKAPAAVFRKTIRAWDKAGKTVAGWPKCTVELEANPRRYAIDLLLFPQSFRDDLAAFLADTGDPDPFSDNYTRAVKPGTIDMRRMQLHQIASALVASGATPIEACTSLAVLVQPDNAKAALRHLRDRKGHTTPYLGQQAQLLRVVAKHWVKAAEEDLLAVSSVAYKLAVKSKGMVAKNRERLRQFDLAENRLALLTLPARIVAHARRSRAKDRDVAHDVMLALAVELLTVAPMRIDNLVGLELERHVLSIRRGSKRVWHIAIPGHQTKNGVPFEVALPADTAQVLEAYLDAYRPRLAETAGPFLFPAPGGGRRSTIPFATAISKFIFRQTGLKMHVHLFRHLAAKFYLEAHPEDIETPRRLLGHRSSATTSRSYAELRTDDAYRRYDRVLAMQKETLARPAATKPGREGKR